MNTEVFTLQPTVPTVKIRDIADLPGPSGWPVVGSLLQLHRARPHQTVEHWCDQYGPLFQMTLGPTPFLVVGDHEAIGAILRDRPDGFRRPPAPWTTMHLSPSARAPLINRGKFFRQPEPLLVAQLIG